MRKVPIAVVSPLVNKRHGTERCLAEQLERLSREYEIHLFSRRVEDTDLAGIVWHRVPEIPGPHLARYLFWLAANHVARRREQWRSGRRFALVFSPGVNCLDADLIQAHIVFAEFYERVRESLRLGRNPARSWPRLIHRRLYYALIIRLERHVYGSGRARLAAISRKTAEDLKRFYPRSGDVPVVYHGIDAGRFDPARRRALRSGAREELGLGADAFAILLVGNDWKKKGLGCLLAAVERVDDGKMRVLIAGEDDPRPFAKALARLGERAMRLPIRRDVEFYYAAADLVAAPSVEDAFSLPPLEAMGAGVPVIVSREAGVSEVVTHGQDGLVLEDPGDAGELAGLLARVKEDAELRERLARNGPETARKFSWDANAEQMAELFRRAIEERRCGAHAGASAARVGD